MNTLVKIMIFTAPVLALVFFYIITQQNKMETQIKMDNAQFERDWHEFASSFAETKAQRQIHKQRAREAEEEYLSLKSKEEERQAKVERLERAFDEALERLDHEVQKKLDRR